MNNQPADGSIVYGVKKDARVFNTIRAEYGSFKEHS
jgi:hypothetical protein